MFGYTGLARRQIKMINIKRKLFSVMFHFYFQVLRPEWSMTGTQGNKWINAQVNVVSTEAYQLVFEALRGTDYRGDIAIDDIKVSYSPCAKTKGKSVQSSTMIW